MEDYQDRNWLYDREEQLTRLGLGQSTCIGIGGDPVRLLRRAAELIRPDGAVIAEVDGPGTALVQPKTVRWETETMAGDWFAWASVSVDATADLARAAGLTVVDIVPLHGRYFARMENAALTSS